MLDGGDGEGGGRYVHKLSDVDLVWVAEFEVEGAVVGPDGGVFGERVPEGCHVLEEAFAWAVGEETFFDFIGRVSR